MRFFYIFEQACFRNVRLAPVVSTFFWSLPVAVVVSEIPFHCFTVFVSTRGHILRRHAYSNVLKIVQPKKEKFQINNSDIFILLLKT